MISTYEDCFNLMCGAKIGEGLHREVFECRVRPDLVVKVENSDHRFFANVMEMLFWSEHKYDKEVAKWLAPCEYLSPDGRILLQRKASPVPCKSKLPKQLPAFLTDLKIGNFGMLNGKLVCVDYALNIQMVSTRMVKAWWS